MKKFRVRPFSDIVVPQEYFDKKMETGAYEIEESELCCMINPSIRCRKCGVSFCDDCRVKVVESKVLHVLCKKGLSEVTGIKSNLCTWEILNDY
jgi:hypothetical protein